MNGVCSMLRIITKITQKIENWASQVGLIYKIAESYYLGIVEKEVVLANITNKDNILFIGGGICPFSAILLHRKTGAKITVIDNDISCVQKATQLISRMGLGGHVTVLCLDGRNVDLTPYSVVHFALQICPLECVFSYIEKHVTPGTKLLIRRPRKQFRKFYSWNSFRHLPSPLLRFCPFTTHPQARNIGSTLLYIKEG